jgi:superfamily II DNA or RNA helicase
MNPGEWAWSTEHREICRIVESLALWGEHVCRVWLPGRDAVVRVRTDRLAPLTDAGLGTPSYIAYVTAAARVADALSEDVLLAPIEASVIPLPHQIRALSRAIAGDSVRYLLADEVGLGKTIEAGLIMRELKLRGLVRRTLVVAPKGLVTQWVSEMRLHFNEEFRLVLPEDLRSLARLAPAPAGSSDGAVPRAREHNPWRLFDQVVCPIDSVKPMETRRGWSRQQVAEYNQERFDDLIAAGWDLVIVDEAHRLGGSTDQVARYKLGLGLAEAAPYLLLLSATPHQGKTDSFYRLISLLDRQAFPDPESVARERVQPYVVRTEKRRAIDAGGLPLFKPRQTRLIPVAWTPPHAGQNQLYEAVTEYVREGYNQALKEKRSYIGFLMILMQRLVTSSTRAIRTTLTRRLEVLEQPEEQLSLFPALSQEEWSDLDGQEQIDTLVKTRFTALKNERAEVERLLALAERTETAGPDAKAEALLEWIYRLQQEETDPELKILVFTEFVPTQEMLHEFLTARGIAAVSLNGSLAMEERRAVQRAFANEVRVLVSTEAGGEGLNLQFCHVVINYDMPWNPMRIEQRIGRVDRIGQKHVVRALNFVLEETVEYRVREVLEEKLAVILTEFGVDKTGDVLDSAQAGQLFDGLYVEAIFHPEAVEAKVDAVMREVREQGNAARNAASMLGDAEALDAREAQRVMQHPLPHWVERMTISYLDAYGGKAMRRGRVWDLTWPDGTPMADVVFTGRDAEAVPAANHLTLEDTRVRGLAARLPLFAEGEPIPCLGLPSLPGEVRGLWSLWRVAIHAPDRNRQRIMPLFVHDDGRVLQPTARHLWDVLLSDSVAPHSFIDGNAAREAFDRISRSAQDQGRQFYDDLVRQQQERLRRERDKGEYAFAARRRAVERLGLPAVRLHRLRQLEDEERAWRKVLDERTGVTPELMPLLLLRIEGG